MIVVIHSSLRCVFVIGISQKGKLLEKKEYITGPRVYHMEDVSLKEREKITANYGESILLLWSRDGN